MLPPPDVNAMTQETCRQQTDVAHAASQTTTLTLGLSLAPGGCPRIAIVARAKLTERDFSII
ncbi:hypothetical protein [Nitrosomonas halophila]|uniref:hypothetical protein n=1 Tax=Nitrosomonas halophila TaxID=44576 RepID=UPI000B86DB48|nr:hypothetical protein [Nitrosomonas halophila]